MKFSGTTFRRFSGTIFLFSGTIFSLCFLGCGERVPAAVEAEKRGILSINNGGEPSALDPQFAQPGVIENRIMLALFEGLVRYDPENLEPIPALAESWKISSDGLRYEFSLRKNAKFSDGTPISSKDFLFSFRRILSPKLASPCASLFFAPVKNAKKFALGEITDFSLVGFSAPNPETLVVELENPCPYFLSLLCHSSWSVVPAHKILQFGKIDERSTLWTRQQNFVGSGPFRLKSWRVAYRIEVEKNPFYWDAKNVALNGIKFDAIEDQFAEETAFNDGQFHITNTVPPSRIAILREHNSPQLRLDEYFSTVFVRINCSKFPLNDVRVRRALSLALDRNLLAEKVLRGGETPAFRLVPAEKYSSFPRKKNVPENSENGVPENVKLARELLAEAGFPGGENFPEISYLFNTSAGSQFFAQALQEMWRKNLGIKISLKNQEYKVFRVSLANGDFDLARSAWSGDYLDPTTFLELFTSNGNMNWTFWKNSRYDELLEKAARERVPEKRAEILRDAEDLLLSEVPVIPTVHSPSKFLIRKNVKGWFPNLLDIHPYNSVFFENADK